MRIALISDIHGNAIAFEAVLADLERAGSDSMICLGDVATLGPEPRRAIDLVRGLGCPCILGNHDEFMVDPDSVARYTRDPLIVGAIDWCRERLTDDDLAFLETFLPTLEIALPNGGNLLLFHGTPRSNIENLLSTTPAVEVDAILDGHVATVFAGGHTHIAMLRQHRGRLIVNPGSVGTPFLEFVGKRTPALLDHAEYAILTIGNDGMVSAELRRVEVGRDRMRAAAEKSTNPLSAFWTDQYSS